jgi:hypothetical protein
MATTVSLKPNAVEISGSTSGTTTLQATAVAGTTTLTLPAATDTLVGKETTDTLTNKSLTSPTITGVATFAAGTAAAPAITTTGDTNTGIWFPAADTIAFTEGGVESMRIDSSGNLQTIGTISVGNATPSTSGAGITFPATQSASTDANTLDDYEEGTWTPAVTANGGSITTVGTVSGSYIKIGRAVHAFFSIAITINGTGSGSVLVANIPFAPSAANTSMGIFREQLVNGKMGSVNLPNTTQLQLQFYDNTYPGSNGCQLVGEITYYV